MIGYPILQPPPLNCGVISGKATTRTVQLVEDTDTASCLALSAAQSLSGSLSCVPGQIGMPLIESQLCCGGK